MRLWGRGIVVIGAASLLLVALTGCGETANPGRVAVVDRAVKAIAPASLGRVVCDKTVQNNELMSTVRPQRTIALLGVGKDEQLIQRLNNSGFPSTGGTTTAGGEVEIFLTGPKGVTASVFSARKSFGIDNHGRRCTVPKQGVTLVQFDL